MKELNTAVIFMLIAGWMLMVNSLNFPSSSKYILYMFTFVFLGAWLIYIIRS
jgi:hypothetical protein